MKKAVHLFLISVLVLVPFVAATATSETSNDQLTRGEFFQTIVDTLNLSYYGTIDELPSDVTEDSPYADAVRIMLERQVVQGYPDGTIGVDRPIARYEAVLIISRFLGIHDSDAITALSQDFGLAFTNERYIAKSELLQGIENTLVTPQDIYALVERSSVNQLAQQAYRLDVSMIMDMLVNDEDFSDEEESISMEAFFTAFYHQEQGIQINLTMDMLEGLEDELTSMDMVQYVVPEGVFVTMVDPYTDEEMWVNFGSELFTFEELMEVQKEGLDFYSSLNSDLMFYRHLGMEEINGASAHKIGLNSRITSVYDLLDQTNGIMQDQLIEVLADISDVPNMHISMSGTIWIDEETELPVKMSVKTTIQFSDNDTSSAVFHMNVITEGYLTYDEVIEIGLPEEALSAPSFMDLLDEWYFQDWDDEDWDSDDWDWEDDWDFEDDEE